MATATQPTFISLNHACKSSGLSAYTLMKAVMLGKVRVEAMPGVSTRYHSDDVFRLKAERQAAAAGAGTDARDGVTTPDPLADPRTP